VDYKALLLACTIIGSGLSVLVGQQPGSPAVFTLAQAEAGRLAYEKTCVRCHTTTLLGRKGNVGELPPVDSLSASDQEFIKKFGPVPALARTDFITRWKDKTVAQVIARFQEGVNAFPPEGVTSETAVEITAYALQISGAKTGDRPLIKTSDVAVRSIVH
jgi:cytochrome c5